MIRYIFFIFALGASSQSLAMQISLFPVVLNQHYMNNEDGDLYFQKVDSLAASLTFDSYQFGIESGRWSTESGTPLIGFKETVQTLNTCHLFRMGSTFERLYFYSGIGIGSYETELVSQFNGLPTTTKSGQTLYSSGIVSIQAIFWFIHLDTELKLVFGKDFRPQPTPDLAFKLGAVF